MPRRRYASKFTSFDGLTSYVFPAFRYEYEPTQPLRSARALVPGGHYGVRLLGSRPALKDVAQERIRFVSYGTSLEIDTEIDNLRSKLYTGAFGWLYTLGADGTERRARAELAEMPQITIAYGSPHITPVVLGFNRFSDWYGTTETDLTFTVNADPYNFNVTNAGNAPVYNPVLILKGPFTNPVLTNNTNGYIFGTTRDATLSTEWLKIDAGEHTIEWSTNSGGSWDDDYALYTRPTGQVQLMRFEPGVNSMTITGANGSTLDVNFYPGFH